MDNKGERLVGWVICRLRDDFDENDGLGKVCSNDEKQSLSKFVMDLVYGNLSNDNFPPADDWVFLATERKLSIVAHGFTNEEIAAAASNPITIQRFRRHSDAYGKQNDIDSIICGCTVSNCPISEMNGTYFEQGSHDGVPMYIHVRKWCIVRLELPELPELGISAADTYRFKHEGGNSAFFFRKAENSFLDIVDSSSTIKEGSSAFTRKFIDLVRAGSKLVTADQTLYVLHENDRRSAIQSKNSSLLLERINTSKNELDTHTMSTQANTPHNMSKQPSTNEIIAASLPSKSTIAISINHNAENSNEMGDDQVTAEMVLSREVTFFQENNHINADTTTKEWQTDAEAELQREVLAAIEIREELLHHFLLLAHESELQFLESELQNEGVAKEKLVESLQKLRNATLDYFDVYQAWCRVRHVKSIQRMKAHSEKKTRSFAVIVAYHSTLDLYPASEAMHSNIKRYSRNRETAVKKIELSFIGDFPTRETAVEALENAMKNIPQEQWLVEDIQAASKAIVTFRPCQQHYLVRTYGVNPLIPCELCQIRQKIDNDKLKQKDVFLYKTVDYNNRMMKDLASMTSLQFMQRVFTSMQWDNNPLLLDTPFVDFILNKSRHNSSKTQKTQALRSKTSEINTTNQSQHRGKIELLHEALDFSRSYQESNRIREKNKKYETSPFNSHTLLTSSSASSLLHKNRVGSTGEEDGSSMTVPFPPELVKRIKNAVIMLYDRHTFFQAAAAAAAALSGSSSTANSNNGNQEMPRPVTASAVGSTNDFNKTSTSALQNSQAFRNTLNNSSSNNREMVVEAIYSDHGASITHTQTRLLPAHREPDIWCRTDIGEFAGLITTKGRNMRSYEFQEALVAEGKRKEKYRKLLQSKLRAVLEIHAVDVNVDSIYALLEEAKAVRGSTLNLDILQVENFVKWYFKLIHWITRAQSIYHGNKARVYYRTLLSHEHIRKLRQKLLCSLVDKEAKRLVTSWIETTVQKEVKRKIFSMKVTCVVNLSGHLAIATVKPASRNFRKTTRLLCSACSHQTSNLHYHITTGTYSRRKFPCTCTLIQEEETWAVSFYLPLNGQTFKKKVGITEIQKVILQFESARLHFHNTAWLSNNVQVMNSSFLQMFASILPSELINQHLGSQSIINGKFFPSSYSQAMLQSGKESMTPLRYPRMLLPSISAILTTVNNGSDDNEKGLQELRKKLDLVQRTYQQSIILSNYHHIHITDKNSHKQQSLSWEPFVEVDFATRDLQQVHHDIDITKTRLTRTLHELQLKEQELTSKTQAFELSSMAFEDQYSRIQETQWQLLTQQQHNIQVMSTTKQYYDRITSFEQQEKLDLEVLSSQPQVESASTWKNMHFYNKFHKQLVDEILILNSLFVTLQARKLEFYQALPQKIDIMAKIKNHELQLTQIQMTILGFENRLHAAKRNVFNVVRHYCQAWSMPRRLPRHSNSSSVVDLDEKSIIAQQQQDTKNEENEASTTHSHHANKKQRRKFISNQPIHSGQHKQREEIPSHHEEIQPVQPPEAQAYQRSIAHGKGQGQRVLQQILPYSLLLTREARTRLDKNHRLLLSGILRQVVRIQYDQLCQRVVQVESQHVSQFIRSQAAVFFDDLHKTIIIHLDGQDNDAAEAVQHEDFGYDSSKVFTSMAQFAQRRDIVLTHDEALMLFRNAIIFTDTATTLEASDERSVGSNLSRRSNFKLLLPSERPRSTAHIKVIHNPHTTHHSTDNTSNIDTYHKRLVTKEKQDFELAQSLITQLRLQPFTARPCLGKLHFIRRQKMVFDHVMKCSWYNDLLSSHTPPNLHILTTKTIFMLAGVVNKSRVMLTIKEFFYRLEVSVAYKHVDRVLPLVVKLELNVNTFFHQLLHLQQPIGILHLLGMIWVNEYNSEVISPLLQKSTLQLRPPGQLTTQHFRRLLATEIPVLTQLKTLKNGFKRVHSEHRFVGGLYADAYMNRNETGDLQLEIRPAWDGKFIRHCYTGSDSLVVSLSLEAVRLLLLQAGNDKLFLLHAKEVYKLFHFLYDCLDPNIFLPSSPVPAAQASGIVNVTTGISCDILKLKSFAETFIAQHHDWISKRYPHKQHLLDINRDTEQGLLLQLEILSHPARWKFNIHKPISPKVKVYEGLFGFGHTQDDHPFDLAAEQSGRAADHIICQATTCTDANKSQLWIQLTFLSLLTHTNPTPDEESLLLRVERSQFQLEDKHSEQRRKMEADHQHLQTRQHEFKEIKHIAQEKKQLLSLQTLQKGFTTSHTADQGSSSICYAAAELLSLLLHYKPSKDTAASPTHILDSLGIEQMFCSEKMLSKQPLPIPRLPPLPHRDELRAPNVWLRSTLLMTPKHNTIHKQKLSKLVNTEVGSFVLQSVCFDHKYQALVFDVINLDSCHEFQLYILISSAVDSTASSSLSAEDKSKLLQQVIQSTLTAPMQTTPDELLQPRKLAQQQHKIEFIRDDKLQFISSETIRSAHGKRSISLYSANPRVVKKEKDNLQVINEQNEQKEKEAKESKESAKKEMRQMKSQSKSRRSFNNSPAGGASNNNAAMLEAIAQASTNTTAVSAKQSSKEAKDKKSHRNVGTSSATNVADNKVTLLLIPQDNKQRYETYTCELHLIRHTATIALSNFTRSQDSGAAEIVQRKMIGHVVIFFFNRDYQKNDESLINERLVEVLKLTNSSSNDRNNAALLQFNVVILLRHKQDLPRVTQLLDDHFSQLRPLLEDQRRRAGQEKQFQHRRQLVLQQLSHCVALELQLEMEEWMTGKPSRHKLVSSLEDENDDEVEVGIWPQRKKFIALQLLNQTSALLAHHTSEDILKSLSMLNSNVENETVLELFTSNAQAEDAELLPALEQQQMQAEEDQERYSQLKLPKKWLLTKLESIMQYKDVIFEQVDQDYQLEAIFKLMTRLLSPLHILATTLLSHCQSCTLPLALCPLPACRWIRNENRLLLQQEAYLNSSAQVISMSLVQVVEHYFCQFCNKQNSTLLHQLPTQTQLQITTNKLIQPPLTLTQDIIIDKSIDQYEIDRRWEAKRLARGWQETRFYNELFLILSPFLQSSEVRQLCGGDERVSLLLQAKGGVVAATQVKRLQVLLEQALHNELPFPLPSFLQLSSIPTVAVGAGSRGASALLRRSNTNKRFTSAGKKNKTEDSRSLDQTLAEGSLSMSSIIPLLKQHHDEVVDVYPADAKGGHQQHPMDKDTFNRLIRRIRISPPSLISGPCNPSSDDNNNLAAHGMLIQKGETNNKAMLSLDRLLCEGLISLAIDHSLVIVQILYGTIINDKTNQIEGSSDISSVRFVPQTFWSHLQPGLLISIYDCRSMVSKAIVLELLPNRSAVQEARELFDSLPKRLRLSRIGDYCVTATLQSEQPPQPVFNNDDVDDALSTSIMSLSSCKSMTIKAKGGYKGNGRYIMGSMTAQRMQKISSLVANVDAK